MGKEPGLRPYLARVEQEWIALGRNHLAGRRSSLLSLVKQFAPSFPDLNEAMAQAIEAELEDSGKTRGRKPTEANGYQDVLAGREELRCAYPHCQMKRMPKRVRCLAHLKKQRETGRHWYAKHKKATA